MIDYLKKNHLSVLIIAFLVASSFLGNGLETKDVEKIVEKVFSLGAINRSSTTISNPHTFQEGITVSVPPAGGASLTVNGASTLTGTTTITQSVDGLVVGGTFSTAATGTVRTLYTNSTGPKFCDSNTAFLYVKNNGSFSPSLVFSLGTSTTAVASTNLVASSTVATTTTALIVPTASSFVLGEGDVLTAIIGDITNTSASSTYYGNWSAEAGVWCQDISI